MPVNNDASITMIMRRQKLKNLKEKIRNFIRIPTYTDDLYSIINKFPINEALSIEQFLNGHPVTIKTIYDSLGKNDYILITEGTIVSSDNKKIVSYTLLKAIVEGVSDTDYLVNYTYIDRTDKINQSYFLQERFASNEFKKALKLILDLRAFKAQNNI